MFSFRVRNTSVTSLSNVHSTHPSDYLITCWWLQNESDNQYIWSAAPEKWSSEQNLFLLVPGAWWWIMVNGVEYHAPEPSAGLCCYLIRSTFLCFTPEHRKWRFKLFQIKTRLTRIYLTDHVSKHQSLIGLIPLRLITHQDNFLLLWSPGVIDHLRENAHICPVQRDSSQKPIIPLNNRNTSNRLSVLFFIGDLWII